MSETVPDDCVFCRIERHEIPAQFVYEDEYVFVIKDRAPKAPVHLLVIPRKHIMRIDTLQPEDDRLLVHIFEVIRHLVAEYHLEAGYRVVINSGRDGGQTVPHLHVHILAGKHLEFE